MKVLKKLLVLVLFLTLFTTACGNNAEKAGETASESTDNKELQEVSVVLDWYPNAVHAFIYDAIEKGYYENEGLKVNIIFPANPNDGISMPAANKADLGIYYIHDVIQSKAEQNIPVKMVGSIMQDPANIILSLKEKNINSPKDFEGKTIGYGGTVLSEAMIRTMMKHENVDPEKVNFLDVGFDLMSAMTTHKVDATIGCLEHHEVPQMIEEGFDVSYFGLSEYGVPNFPELVFVASDDTIKNKNEMLEKFMRASRKGFEDMKNDKYATLKILLDNQNEENFPLSENVEKQSIDNLIPKMENEKNKFLTTNKEDVKKTIDWMRKEEIITKDVTVDDVVSDIK